MLRPFQQTGATQTIAATTTSANASFKAGSNSLMVVNSGTTVAFCKVGVGAQTATSADLPLRGGDSMIISISALDNNIGVILASGSGSVYACPGQGQ